MRAGAPAPFTLEVPGDPSSAAFFVVAAAVTPGSELVLEDVSLNPGRIAFLDVLRAMGADIEVTPRDERLGEPVGDIQVVASPLRGTVIDCPEAIIDEIPALAIAAAFAEGVTDVRNAAELRVKESDRIATLEQELTRARDPDRRAARRVDGPRRDAAAGRVRQPRRPSHRDGGGGRRQRGRG